MINFAGTLSYKVLTVNYKQFKTISNYIHFIVHRKKSMIKLLACIRKF